MQNISLLAFEMRILSTRFPTSERILKFFSTTFTNNNNNFYPAYYFIVSLPHFEVGGREKEISWGMWVPEHSHVLSRQEILETKGNLSERDSHNVTDIVNINFALKQRKHLSNMREISPFQQKGKFHLFWIHINCRAWSSYNIG
jgi:hypothetical protein